MDKRVSPIRYFLAFLGSLDFHMEYLYPFRYLYDKNLPTSPEGLPGAVQIGILMRKVVINLPIFSEGERKDLYRLCGEDVAKHLKLSFDDGKEYQAMAVKMIQMAIDHTDIAEIIKFAEQMAKGMGVKLQ